MRSNIQIPLEKLYEVELLCCCYCIGWQDVSTSDQQLLFACIQVIAESTVITTSLTIYMNYSWQLCVQGNTINLANYQHDSNPTFLNTVCAVQNVIIFVNGCTICCGNADERFTVLAKSRKGKFLDALGMSCSYTIFRSQMSSLII